MYPDAITRGVLHSLEIDGFVIVERLLDQAPIANLVGAIQTRLGMQSHLSAGTRNLHQAVPAVAELIDRREIRALLDGVLPSAFAVRSILFDKTPETNWKVAWHQDLTICVQERIEVEGFGPWSVKDGVNHVQPPASVLEGMVTMRIHLDDCGEENGPLMVMPRSHKGGRLSADDIARWRTECRPVSCVVRRGGVVLMKPLLLHASSAAQNPSHRRVIHVEFSADELPGGLRWLECTGSLYH
jgi:hypothetical protein